LSLTLTLPAFAKINLDLRVLGTRANGYHELETTFQTISLHDTLTMSVTEGPYIILSSDDRTLPTNDQNMVIKAAKVLQSRSDSNKGVKIRLGKRIPTQAGLGGGSADAAVALMGLSQLWELHLTKTDLLEMGSQLGADVPFFFFGGTARATGIGEQIEPLDDIEQMFLLILKPNASISTADAYRSFDERSLTSPDAKIILSSSEANKVFDRFANLTNDFEAVAFDLEPEIRRAKAALLNAGATAALLAGSGSAVFGIFDSEDAQRRAIQAIELETGWRVFPCKTIGREEYQKALGSVSEARA
jgi:4-diphosphocytidyl-2-C-methyl-D-erythritol kinase